ncbi:MAG: maleylpyruvate isomerase family mycothiol-dependent enzyme [Stackebrandtia sp.]
MEFNRLSACWTEDAARLAKAAEGNMEARVPSCPDWTVTDLLEHVAQVYNHKTECIKNGKPENWPPPRDPAVPTMTLLRQALGNLLAELTPREPSQPAYTWYDPDQTVGFWIRRMAQETVMHRVDAELAAGGALSPIDEDLAVDGIDEVLRIMVAWDSQQEVDEYADSVSRLLPKPVAVKTGETTWVLRPEGRAITVASEPADDVAVTISGEPAPLLLWLWRRGDDEVLEFDGDPAAARAMHELLAEFTQ